jgi:hypothetical protein
LKELSLLAFIDDKSERRICQDFFDKNAAKSKKISVLDKLFGVPKWKNAEK